MTEMRPNWMGCFAAALAAKARLAALLLDGIEVSAQVFESTAEEGECTCTWCVLKSAATVATAALDYGLREVATALHERDDDAVAAFREAVDKKK